MYEVIVLGATFAAAGIAHTYKKNCLVLEQGLQAGTEFYGALQYGTGYYESVQAEAAALAKAFAEGSIYSCDAEIYPYLQEADILFGSKLAEVEKTESGFVCTVHCVDGFHSFAAKQVIDTRCNEKMALSKTFNMLMESKETPSFSGVEIAKAGLDHHYVLRMPVALSCSFPEARAAARKIVEQFSQTQNLLLSAWMFDYQVNPDYPKTKDGILYLPSKLYKNPVLAFAAGLEVGE